MGVVRVIVVLLCAFLLPRAALIAENLALRHQLGVLQRSVIPHLGGLHHRYTRAA